MKNVRALIADEDSLLQRRISSFLGNLGCNVTLTYNQTQTTKALYENDFEILITDLAIWRADGIKILEELKEWNPNIQIILLSSHHNISAAIRALRIRTDNLIVKGDLTEIQKNIIRSLEKLETRQKEKKPDMLDRLLSNQIMNMVTIMSHDIRNLLVTMISVLKMLDRGYYGMFEEKVGLAHSELYKMIVKLIGMTEDYMGKACLVNDSLDIRKNELDLEQDVIKEVLEELSLEISKMNIHITIMVKANPSENISIAASKSWIKAVYRNLLSNAIKHGGQGCTVTFGCKDDGHNWRLNVANSGNPVPIEERHKLFTKFGQIEKEPGKRTDGMGLGLYLVKEIVKIHGGDIWYESQPDGSNFIFTLPKPEYFTSYCEMTEQSHRVNLA